jgi:hypothetical protein
MTVTAAALRARPALWAWRMPVVLGAATILAQIAYPLVSGAPGTGSPL